ncbi:MULTISPECIES: hypothetical protein [Megasphaera]|uniref:Uncharacterized protein n=2 Tax=Megasphaera TaxID=906 RepID=A0ABT1SPS2_9FIRM|nr:hypothetical protein [Megasphaera massiliensis]KXA67204.1 hypothetical protein HMPREF3201_02015 [Megasphaera sp. MJR8396C]MCB6232503.1 hypothetical protein [Megasphaera massiliensis]MCB6399059.1 hypothetical protein [Megasphaera massiliensis]MCB6403335.1 hypothetical protein [Megasphaera massiliensis]MCB7348065.1 hypothetical protein [Megasphaera massiliensis]
MTLLFNPSLLQKVQEAIAENPDKRVIPLSFDGMNYFIKRRMSNGRNAFAKQNPSASFWCEAYKIMTVNSRLPLAPKIVLLDEDFFVMENVGKTLQRVAKEEDYADVRLHAFTKAGEGLARLHVLGLHHGRPALRDIAYHRENDSVTLLDWENEKKFIQAPAAVLDLFLFIHSCFREEWSDTSLLNAALAGYASVEGSKRTLKGLKNLILDYNTLFYICHVLRPFGWIDVVSVDKARHYISKL